MYVPPPVNPDEHLMRERNRRAVEDRDARRGQPRREPGTLSTGDKIIFLVLGFAMLAGILFLLLWLLS